MPVTAPCLNCKRSVTRPPSAMTGKVFCCTDCRAEHLTGSGKQWRCIDCGSSVGRKVKRCPECDRKSRSGRSTYVRTPEHRRVLSERQKGKPKPALRGRKRPEVGRKIAAAWTEEMKEAARDRGKRLAQDREWLERIARALSGENNPMWQGGIAGQKYAPGFCKTLKGRIRERDGYTCQLCGRTEDDLGYSLSIHHSDYDKSNHSDSNLFATCKRCNSLVNARREFWTAWFRDLARRRQLL